MFSRRSRRGGLRRGPPGRVGRPQVKHPLRREIIPGPTTEAAFDRFLGTHFYIPSIIDGAFLATQRGTLWGQEGIAGNTVLEDRGIFLNSVNQAVIRVSVRMQHRQNPRIRHRLHGVGRGGRVAAVPRA